MSNIYDEIKNERTYQDQKWGHKVDDTLNTPWMWTSYINNYASKWMAGTFAPLSEKVVDDFRAKMVKAAAICIAAIESVDRQREINDKTFFEDKKAA